jgi:anti-sigma-K factor RskA
VSHCDPDSLALIALGEREDLDDEVGHAAECEQCAAELASLSSVVATGRTVTAEDYPVEPPEHVWADIQRDLGTAPVVDELADRRSRRPMTPWLAVAASAGLIVGGLGVAASFTFDQQTDPTVIAQAALEPLPGNEVAGVAAVQQTQVGAVLNVSVSDLPPREGYYEVWLLTPDVSNMVSVGVLADDGSGTFPLPSALNLGEFSVVDISREEFDGDATHSTDSVVRGSLPISDSLST